MYFNEGWCKFQGPNTLILCFRLYFYYLFSWLLNSKHWDQQLFTQISTRLSSTPKNESNWSFIYLLWIKIEIFCINVKNLRKISWTCILYSTLCRALTITLSILNSVYFNKNFFKILPTWCFYFLQSKRCTFLCSIYLVKHSIKTIIQKHCIGTSLILGVFNVDGPGNLFCFT